MFIPFDTLSDEARIWVYEASRPFAPEEQSEIEARLHAFCQNWNTHGTPMSTSFQIRYGQVILLAAEEQAGQVSGCSIDSSVAVLREIEARFGLDLLNKGKVSYVKSEKEVEVLPLAEVKEAVAQERIQRHSFILNPTVTHKRELEQSWLQPAAESWLKRYFPN
ncbi:MAG: hypothetical protein ACXIT9_08790 [Nitritalea sp.]